MNRKRPQERFLGPFRGDMKGKERKGRVDMKTGEKRAVGASVVCALCLCGVGAGIAAGRGDRASMDKGKRFFPIHGWRKHSALGAHGALLAGDDAVACESIPKTSGV